MAGGTDTREGRWQGRPVQAGLLRVFVTAVPVAAAILSSIVFSSVVTYPSGVVPIVFWWMAVLVVSTGVLLVVDRQARRLLPLAALLKLSMVFPDQAPSRFGVALRSGTVRNLEERLDEVRADGVDDEPARAAEEILELVGLLNAHDPRTRGHAERVRAYTDLLADQMDLPDEERDKLHWAALLHDVGKVMVPREILNKTGRPDEHEWEQLHRHPENGDRLAAPLRPWLGPWADAIVQHHEHWDGSGYPRQLQGEEISLGARMVAVADSFEVMTAARSYKRPMEVKAAREELTRCAGTQFDPSVVRAFLNVSLGKLRWVAGPLAWVGQLPFLRGLPMGISSQVAAIGARALAGAALFAGVAAPALTGSGTSAAAPARPPATSITTVPDAAPLDSTTTLPVPVATTTTAVSSAPKATTATTARPGPAPATTLAPRIVTTSPPPTTRPNLPPVARDDTATTTQHKPVDIDVLSNDADPEGGTLAVPVTITAPPTHGNANPSASGPVHYVPFDKYVGTDSFVYQVCDAGGSCSTATVNITVNP